ncbi:MAG: Zn-dependent hydrolase [Proteobacteria bacterium]|nr:Zn-dependent hydrolase [Pseudomonadota bacterium]
MSQPVGRIDRAFASSLFDALACATRQGRGIVRDTYGAGEQTGFDIVRTAAAQLGLEITIDPIGNMMMTLPGRDRAAPRILIGSHLDSVPQGGNFDGAAGVVAGLCAVAALQAADLVPVCDITVIAIRGEESAWYDVAYIGSAGLFGLLDPACLAVRRFDTGHMLGAAMTAQGLDTSPIQTRRRLIDPASVRAFLELHIEQGPTLVREGLPAAVVTGIRGCQRFRAARCLGAYAHSGAVARPDRRDALAATVALLHHMEQLWWQEEAAGQDLVFTCGELFTDPAMHGPSKVAGETHFVIDLRSLSTETMARMAGEARHAAGRIGDAYRVSFELGDTSYSAPGLMDARLQDALMRRLDRPFDMASGAGHDAVIFAGMGIPTGMIFVRNQNGSHNPDEAMELADFAVGAEALTGLLTDFPI